MKRVASLVLARIYLLLAETSWSWQNLDFPMIDERYCRISCSRVLLAQSASAQPPKLLLNNVGGVVCY